MKIVVCETPQQITIDEAEIPEISSDMILIRIKYCGICVFDLKRFLGLKKI